MIRRLLALLLVGAVGLAGFALAQEPPAKEEPPVRLKKKRPRGEDKPKVEPDKPDEKKDDKAEKKEDKKEAEPREPEPVAPQEEEKEVLQRVIKNVHNVGERLAKNDLGEATQQTQRDILKDLDSLIQRNENPPQGGGDQDQNQGGGGGGADQDNQNQQNGGGQQDQNQQGGKTSRKQQGKGKGGAGGSKNQQGKANGGGTRSGAKPGSGSQSMPKPRPGKGKPSGEKSEKPGGKDGGSDKAGGKDGKNDKGGGGHKNDPLRNRAADQYKHDVWGHLPQTLRAQMDAYSNPQPFMPKYDDVIKQYYRTIAEQGRRKGE